MGEIIPEKVPLVILNDGIEMPALGYGTSDVRLGDRQDETATYEAVRFALDSGYRFFDTAALYMNEEAVGKAVTDAIQEGQISREELFMCTKVWNTHHKRQSVVSALKDSLKRLRLDYVDLYLIHWPMAYDESANKEGELVVNPKDPQTGKLLYSDTHFTETWLGMEDCKDQNLARSIGLSNFNQKQIGEILAMPGLRHKPSLLQVEMHPYLPQTDLHEFCTTHGITMNAYCPLGAPNASWLPEGQPKVIEDPYIHKLAERYNRSPAQIILHYLIERAIVPIPKSNTPSRIIENLEVFDFDFTSLEIQEMEALEKGLRYCVNVAGEHPVDHPHYPFNEKE